VQEVKLEEEPKEDK